MSLPVVPVSPADGLVPHASHVKHESPDSLSSVAGRVDVEDEMLRKLVNKTLNLYDVLQEERRETEDAKLAVSPFFDRMI